MASPYISNFGLAEVTAATLAITSDGYASNTIVSNLAATQTFTLPPATGTGNLYRVFVKTTKTGSLIIQVTTTDVMSGAIGVSTDAAGVVIPTAATSDTLTMNGSTTGGIAGSYAEFQDIAAGTWRVGGALISTGTEATPFSAAVS